MNKLHDYVLKIAHLVKKCMDIRMVWPSSPCPMDDKSKSAQEPLGVIPFPKKMLRDLLMPFPQHETAMNMRQIEPNLGAIGCNH